VKAGGGDVDVEVMFTDGQSRERRGPEEELRPPEQDVYRDDGDEVLDCHNCRTKMRHK
jgi:hypothetical protein